jgi:formate hydrogenlyase subunit 3/multisubunit Na+/H+ antiporter MnhD subunit
MVVLSAAINLTLDNLPLCIVTFPLLATVLIALFNRREIWRNLVAVSFSGIVFYLCVQLFLNVLEAPVVLTWPQYLGVGFEFKVDLFGALFALFASLVWFMAALFSWTYMSHEHRRTRYYAFLMLTLTGCLGVFLTGELFSLFFFFEMMSLTSYVLVVHAETKEAMAAGRNYLYLSIFGGLSLLAGILLLQYATGTTAITPQGEMLAGAGSTRFFITAFLMIGFGIKAGMVPLHIWLPKAHPVAPSPASALLSGIMIKTGAYGIIRVVNLIITPAAAEHGHWHFSENAGYVMIWFAVVTMFSAAVMALFQSNIKRILAYSSISQMGYILMGVGCAAYLGYEGAIAFGGFTYHILNHAFFKAGLFMMAGAIYARTHELELSRLGGLARSAPVTTVAFLVSAAGIAGFPGFNGYISKTLLHHAIVEAFQHHHLFSLRLAEIIFTLTGALTVCYIFKLFTGIFTGSRPAHLTSIPREPFLEKAVFGAIAAAVLYLGLAPQAVLKKAIAPAANSFTYDSYKINYLLKQHFLNTADLVGVLIPIALGLTLLYVLKRRKLFQKVSFPAWLSIDRAVYAPLSRSSLALFTAAGGGLEQGIDGSYLRIPAAFGAVCRGMGLFEGDLIDRAGRRLNKAVVQVREKIYALWMALINAVFGNLALLLRRGFKTLFQVDYRPRGSKLFQVVNISNLDFDLLLIVMILVIILGLIFLFGH